MDPRLPFGPNSERENQAKLIDKNKKTFLFKEREPSIGYSLHVKTSDVYGPTDGTTDCDWGNGGVKGKMKLFFQDDSSILLEESMLDLDHWYTQKLKDDSTQQTATWMLSIDLDFKKIFKGIVTLMAQLSPPILGEPGHLGRVQIFHEGNLYEMSYEGKEGYQRDLKILSNNILSVLQGLPVTSQINKRGGGWSVPKRYQSNLLNDRRLMKFSSIIRDINNFMGQEIQVPLYGPYFWGPKQRRHFMERLYDIFWVESPFNPVDVHPRVNQYFLSSWLWTNLIPETGPYHKVFNHNNNPRSPRQYNVQMDSILYWRNCKFYYNHHVNLAESESYKTVEELDDEMNDLFDIAGQTFSAICTFVIHYHDTTDKLYQLLIQRLVALGEEVGFYPISTPRANNT